MIVDISCTRQAFYSFKLSLPLLMLWSAPPRHFAEQPVIANTSSQTLL